MTCSSLSCKLYQGDCFEWLKTLPDASVDFICTDMPYGITDAPWDCKVDLQALWAELKRIAKPAAAYAMFGSGKFGISLGHSNFKSYRYRYVWDKSMSNPTGFLNANRRPLTASEDILVFYEKQPTYNPQRYTPEGGASLTYVRDRRPNDTPLYGIAPRVPSVNTDGKRCPIDVLKYKPVPRSKVIHNTQKPVDLLEFFVKTYTNEGQIVLDPFMGSGSCGEACLRTNRRFIGMEKDANFFDIAAKRLRGVTPQEYSFELFGN